MKCFGLLFLSVVSTSFAFAPAGGLVGKTPFTSTSLFATRAIGAPPKKAAAGKKFTLGKSVEKIAKAVPSTGKPLEKIALNAAPAKNVAFSFGNGKVKPAAAKAKAVPGKKTNGQVKPVATKAKATPVAKTNGKVKPAATKPKAAPVKKAGFSFGKTAPAKPAGTKTKAKAAPVTKSVKPKAEAAPVKKKSAAKKAPVKKAVKKPAQAEGALVKIVSKQKPGGGYEVKMVKVSGGNLPTWYSKK